MKKMMIIMMLWTGLAGCSQLRPVSDGAPEQAQAGLSPQLMYQLLIVEMMARRGEYGAAFKQLKPLVEKTRDPQLAHRLFQLSMQTYRPDAIEEASQLWHEIEPDNPTPLRALWLLKLRQGDVRAALEIFDRYQKVTPEPLAEDLALAAQRVAGAIETRAALAFAEALLQRYPGWAAQKAAGDILLAKGRAQAALERYRAALSAGAEPARVYPDMARAWLEAGQAQAGLKALRDYVTTHPEDWQVQAAYARLEVDVGDLTAAQKRFEQVLRQKPDADMARLALGLLLFESGRLDEARAQFEPLLRNPVTAQVAAYYLAQVLEQQGDLKSAAGYYAQIRTPKYQLSARLRLVDILYRVEGLDAALKLLDRLSARNGNEQAQLMLARLSLYARAGQRDRALALAKKLVEHAGADRDVLMSLAAELYELKADALYERALRRVLSLAPDDADALNALGYFFVERNRNLDEAERLLKKAISRKPAAFYIEDSIGWLYWRRGELDEAARWLNRALSRQADPEVLAHLLEVEAARRNWSALRRLHQTYRSLFQQDEKIRTLWRRIEREMSRAQSDSSAPK